MNKPEWIQPQNIQTRKAATDGIVVASCSLADLFSGKNIQASDGSMIRGQLRLPEYQRPYRWGKDEVGRLLNDLGAYFDPPTGTPTPTHHFFLGSVILHQQESDQHLNIIDGQQRLTTMGLITWLKRRGSEPALSFDSPISQQRIRNNITWLQQQDFHFNLLDLKRINIVLVVTRSEDDAYRFFETQNTGGVRLGGPDIIKAHHLRAIDNDEQEAFARKWEKMSGLETVVDAVLKARYWDALKFREIPSRLQPVRMKLAIVDELAERTGSGGEDMRYRSVVMAHTGKRPLKTYADGYAIRQPLNAGVNTVNYLHYFESLHKRLLIGQTEAGLEPFYDFYKNLIAKLEGSAYLKELYDSVLLAYASQFGTARLYPFSLWLFRVAYSRRVSNKKAVREKTVGAFISEVPVYDWILSAYTPEQCEERMAEFRYEVNDENLRPKDVSVKKRFISQVDEWFGLTLPDDALAANYDNGLIEGIREKLKKGGHNGR